MENIPPEVRNRIMDQARKVMESFVEAIKAAVIAAGYDNVIFNINPLHGGYHIAMDASKVPPNELPRLQKICEAAALSFQHMESEQKDDGEWRSTWTADRLGEHFPDRQRTIH